MPTPLGAIVARTRTQILAPLVQSGAISPDIFWADDELLAHVVAGCKDFWRAVVDLHQDHFVKVNTAVLLPAAADQLVGVPSDCFRILHLYPRDASDSGTRLRFRRASLASVDFTTALTRSAIDATGTGGIVYYALVNAGSPVMTPEIYVAPRVTGTVAIRVVYVPTLPALTAESFNPIPGESDHALMAWCAAYALGKQNPDGTLTPDTTWLSVYSTEKESIKIVIEPRDASSPSIVRGVFDDTYGPGLSGSGDEGWVAMPPLKVYGLGSLGVNTDSDAFDLDDRELRKAQNAITDQIGGEGLISRPGYGPVTTAAAPGPVLGGIGVPLANESITGTHFLWIGRGPTT